MIQEIIKQWEDNKGKLEEYFRTTKQDEYDEYSKIVKKIFEVVIDGYQPNRITTVDDGDYQGTQIFLIPKDTYQPSADEYLITHTYYGSCSGCDTLQAICGYNYNLPDEEQIKQYMTLALHLVQKIQKLKGEFEYELE